MGGVVVGLLGAGLLVRSLRTLVFGIGVLDPVSFALTPIVLLIVAVIASYIPARRAARIDPVLSLRSD